MQKAIDDLRSAAEKATGDVRSSIDSAVARLREASTEAGSKAQDQVSNWRGTLEEATDDVRKELGKLGVRAQTSVQALDEIAAEARRAAQEPGQLAPGGQFAIHGAQDALPRLVSPARSHGPSQLRRLQVGQSAVDLRDAEIVVAADREAGQAGAAPCPVRCGEGLVGGLDGAPAGLPGAPRCRFGRGPSPPRSRAWRDRRRGPRFAAGWTPRRRRRCLPRGAG